MQGVFSTANGIDLFLPPLQASSRIQKWYFAAGPLHLKQTNKQTNTQTNKQTNKKTNKQTDRQTDRKNRQVYNN